MDKIYRLWNFSSVLISCFQLGSIYFFPLNGISSIAIQELLFWLNEIDVRIYYRTWICSRSLISGSYTKIQSKVASDKCSRGEIYVKGPST